MPLHVETQKEGLINLQINGHITKLEKGSEEFSISKIVFTVKKRQINKIGNGLQNNQQSNR